MSMTLNQKRSLAIQSEWIRGYYRDLVGMKVVGIDTEFDPDFDFDVWPVIKFEDPRTGEIFRVTVSQDEEGNGPGFLFGLAQFSLDEKVREAYASMDEKEVNRVLMKNGDN